jgi:hypothetical protein
MPRNTPVKRGLRKDVAHVLLSPRRSRWGRRGWRVRSWRRWWSGRNGESRIVRVVPGGFRTVAPVPRSNTVSAAAKRVAKQCSVSNPTCRARHTTRGRTTEYSPKQSRANDEALLDGSPTLLAWSRALVAMLLSVPIPRSLPQK